MTKIGSLFSGIGGFEYGIESAIENSKTIWQVEENKSCQAILKKHWPQADLFDDVRSVGAHNLQYVDILTGGFPCQDISAANPRGRGLHGEKSSLWWEAWRITRELRPRVIIVENSSILSIRGLSVVLGSLASIGYDAEWATLRASWFGSPQRRDRCYIIGYPCGVLDDRQTITDTNKERSRAQDAIRARRATVDAHDNTRISGYWKEREAPAPICRVDNGISRELYPHRRKRIEALGNSIVPQIAYFLGKRIYESGLLSGDR